MKAAIHAMLLFVVSTGCACASWNSTQCRDSCIAKITDIGLCNETCVQLLNISFDTDITAPPPVPDPPVLLSSTYFTFTLQWNDYPQTKYNASPVVYILEVTRHENISDPAIILPFLTRYHATTNTTFTIPQEFVTKTNFSFRLAVVAAQGSSEFSPPSPLYLTNDTCDRSLHSFGSPPGTRFPCPVFNLRINFTATEVLFTRPRISTTLHWDYPHDIHTNLPLRLLAVQVTLSHQFPYTREQACVRYGVQVHTDNLSPQNLSTSESYPLLFGQSKSMYFGCPYILKLHAVYEFPTKKFVAETTFYIPHCIHGFCGCEDDNSLGPTTDSHHIDVDVRHHCMKGTTANVTWRNEAWGNKIPEFYKLVILECPNGNCPSLFGRKREILPADPTKTSHNYIFPNLTEGEQYFVVIGAFDKSGCVLTPTEGQKFKASAPSLTQCRDSCNAKITDTRLCNETCVQLSNTCSDSDITAPPPVPDPPVLLSSTYFTFTLQWDDYPQTKYNASPVVYILEVTRHENISDPAIILPFLTKYHATTNTTFTIPQEFVTKTNFSFRLAVVAAQGSSEFSPPSPLYLTNDTCDRSLHSFGTLRGTPYPCPVFNLRINFTATEVLFTRPRISTTLHWDYPHDIHTNLDPQFRQLDVQVTLSNQFPYTREQACVRYGVQVHNDYLSPQNLIKGQLWYPALVPEEIFVASASTSESFPLLSGQNKPMYFGCPYVIKLQLVYEFPTKKFVAETTFYIPHCIHGFCGCEDDNNLGPTTDSHHIDVDVRQSHHSMNRTTANVTWRNEAWGNKIPEFYKLVILECPNGNCPSLHGRKREILPADPMKTSHSYILSNLTEGEQYSVVIGAFDKSGCLLTPTEGQKFQASVPLTTTPKSTTFAPTAKPSTEPPISQTSAQVPSATTPGNGKTTGVPLTAKVGMSSGTVAAITVPIVLLLVFVLVLVIMCWFRLKRKPHRLHRAPTGLQRLAEHMQNSHRENCLRNWQNNLSSPYSRDCDGSELQVNLPSKSDQGLELNPAYVEQRIQEAMETGDADEFEFGYHRLQLKRVLGKGAFGKVFLAEAYGIGGSQETSLVAVKVLNEKANEDEKEDFKMEINFMKTLGRHENVVPMIGCCTLYPPLCLIVEYVPHGDLLHYLRNLRKTFEMQNRKLQGEDIEKLKNEAKIASSEAKITSDGSELGPGGYSRCPLVPSSSETALSELSHDADQKPLKAKKRRLLRQCKSEGKQLCIGHAFKKYEKFFEPEELAKIKRTNSATSFMGLSASNLFTPRRASDSPQAHYVTRVPPIATDVSNNTETTLVSDTKSKSQPSSPSRTMGVDGALDASDLQSFALQIANGMAYLANRGITHRDLAARNVLVGEEKVLKISDFGLSREGIYVKRSTGKIPLRWLSIEAMRDRIYSTASDVWAFGIVLWEICTLGGFPYPTMNDRDLLEFLLEGNRMDKPDNCTDEIYQIMLACWSRDCEDRPSFQSLSEQLFDMEKEEHPYVNVDPSQDFILPPTAGQDTVGNLINFSDGTFSGASDDRELSESPIHRKQLIAGKIWPQGDGPLLSDAENAAYESSGASSEDLSEPEAKISGNDIVVFSQSTGATKDTENYLNDDSPV